MSHEVVVQLIGVTTTEGRADRRLPNLTKAICQQSEVTAKEMASVNLESHHFMGNGTDAIRPELCCTIARLGQTAQRHELVSPSLFSPTLRLIG